MGFVHKFKQRMSLLKSKKGFTLIEMIVVLFLVSVFFMIIAMMVVEYSQKYMRQMSLSTGAGVCETVMDDIYKAIPHGQNVELFQFVEDENTVIGGKALSEAGWGVNKPPKGACVYLDGTWTTDGTKNTDGTWLIEPNYNRSENTITGISGVDIDLIVSNGIDLGFRKIYIAKSEKGKKNEYIHGLPYDVGYYMGMKMALAFEKVVDGEDVYFNIKFSAESKEGVKVGPVMETSVRSYNYKR